VAGSNCIVFTTPLSTMRTFNDSTPMLDDCLQVWLVELLFVTDEHTNHRLDHGHLRHAHSSVIKLVVFAKALSSTRP
jgi:hypothetical protein